MIEAYEAGQRHFGENYVNELAEKSANPLILEKCPDIKWHFIGHLQNNKVNKVINVPALYMIETLDSEKIANTVDKAWGKLNKPEPLKVLVQVNTSQEEAKHGVSVEEAVKLYGYVHENCKHLNVIGVMTIGQYGYDYSQGPNPDFAALMKCYDIIRSSYNVSSDNIEASMGMSNDFEEAVSKYLY